MRTITPEERAGGLREFLGAQGVPAGGRRAPYGADELRQHLRALRPFGFLAGWTAREEGGDGLDARASGLLYETLAAHSAELACAALIAEGAANSVSRLAGPPLRQAWLPAMLAGERIGCIAVSEAGAGSNPREMATDAVREEGGWRIRGSKAWIGNGGAADVCLVVARTGEEGFSRFLVARADGCAADPIQALGLCGWPLAHLRIDARVKPEALLGPLHGALRPGFPALERNRIFVALIAVGIAQAALERSIRHAATRMQFGRVIGRHGPVQEMLAEMAADVSASRLLAHDALGAFEAGRPLALPSAMAKHFATEAAVRVTSRAIDVHGAAGLDQAGAVEGLFRDARMLTVPDGTSGMNKQIVARELLAHAAAP